MRQDPAATGNRREAVEGLNRRISRIRPDVQLQVRTQQVGGAFGAAVLAVILAGQASAHHTGISGIATAFGHTFWWCLGFTVLAVVPALLLPGRATAAAARP